MSDPSSLELGGLAILGTLGSVCAVLLRSTNKNLESLEAMRQQAAAVTDQLRQELRDHDNAVSNLQTLCANYRYQIGALRAQRKQLKLEIQHLHELLQPNTNQIKKEGQ